MQVETSHGLDAEWRTKACSKAVQQSRSAVALEDAAAARLYASFRVDRPGAGREHTHTVRTRATVEHCVLVLRWCVLSCLVRSCSPVCHVVASKSSVSQLTIELRNGNDYMISPAVVANGSTDHRADGSPFRSDNSSAVGKQPAEQRTAPYTHRRAPALVNAC